MPLDLTTVASYNPPIYQGNLVYVSWVPTAPGLTWQLYVNNTLTYFGTKPGTWVAIPPGSTDRIVAGSVDPADLKTDFSASLPPTPNRRVSLGWTGGTFEGADLVGFRIYGSPGAGQSVSYASPVATVAAFPNGIDAGIGWDTPGIGWDTGPWDASSGSYSWTSGTLANGAWTFAIVPYDTAGNETRPGLIATATIAGPPAEPPPFPDGSRLHYTFIPGPPPRVTLAWNASPG